MDSAEVRALQQPLKDAYRDDPEKAVATRRARAQLDDAISCSVDTGRAIANAGLHPATGGDGTLLCSGDMLLEALVACAGVTVGAVSTSLGIGVTGRRRRRGARRLLGHPPELRARDGRRRRAARHAAQAHRALLRGAADAGPWPRARRQARARGRSGLV